MPSSILSEGADNAGRSLFSLWKYSVLVHSLWEVAHLSWEEVAFFVREGGILMSLRTSFLTFSVVFLLYAA